MKTLTPTAVALAACLLSPSGAAPQAAPAPGPGARVRVTAPGLGLRGRDATLNDTTGGMWTLTLDSGRRWTLPRTALTQVESLPALQGPGPGARVRITAPGQNLPRQAGTLVDTAGGVWAFRGARWPAARELDPGDIEEVEVVTGSHENAGKGMAVGLAVGTGLGALFGSLAGGD
ncbi:MAG: hypothetical protein FIA95_15395, partial [Gemmatimonadetes bacterium]|nr:hypothetical protein [Gemmatimonadota bacterium]